MGGRNIRQCIPRRIIGIIAGVLFFCSAGARAQVTERYGNGSEGIKAATLPPPGLYIVSYNVWYHASSLNDRDGNVVPKDFSLTAFATVQRFVWVTELNVLGGNYGISLVFPYKSTRLEPGAPGVLIRESGFGDLVLDQFIRWSNQQADIGIGVPVFFPTGRWDPARPGVPGRGYYTVMPTVGVTYYWDEHRKWASSVLARYEFQTKQRYRAFTPGQDFHFEWGMSMAVAPQWQVGLVGFCQWQVTDDKGSDAVNTPVHDRAFAVGPEVDYIFRPAGLVFKARYEKEFSTVDRPQGGPLILTVVKVL
jgi:hypothetical protein